LKQQGCLLYLKWFFGLEYGAAVTDALHVAKKIKYVRIIILFPDRGDRYLITNLLRLIFDKFPA